MRTGATIAALAVVLAGCGWFEEAEEPPAASTLEPAGDERPSAPVARPAPASRLAGDDVVASDLERIEQLRESLDAESVDGDTLVSLPGDVLFGFDQATVTDAGRRTLADLAELIVLEDPPAVRVEGHTDSVGDPDYNRDLSERRAEAVAAVLVEDFGIDADLLDVRGFGEDRPVASNTTDDDEDDPEGRALNRRVEVILADR